MLQRLSAGLIYIPGIPGIVHTSSTYKKVWRCRVVYIDIFNLLSIHNLDNV